MATIEKIPTLQAFVGRLHNGHEFAFGGDGTSTMFGDERLAKLLDGVGGDAYDILLNYGTAQGKWGPHNLPEWALGLLRGIARRIELPDEDADSDDD